MTLENFISFTLGALAINVKTPLEIQTPLENMFSSSDLHEIILSGIKIIVGGLISVGINKLFHTAPKNKVVK